MQTFSVWWLSAASAGEFIKCFIYILFDTNPLPVIYDGVYLFQDIESERVGKLKQEVEMGHEPKCASE